MRKLVILGAPGRSARRCRIVAASRRPPGCRSYGGLELEPVLDGDAPSSPTVVRSRRRRARSRLEEVLGARRFGGLITSSVPTWSSTGWSAATGPPVVALTGIDRSRFADEEP